MKSIAFFDLDGTITSKDTMWEFLEYTHGKTKLVINILLLSPVLILLKLKIIPNWKAKIMLLSFFYKGWEHKKLKSMGEKFALKRIPEMVYPKAMERITWHLGQRHEVVVVSASAALWIESWCADQNMKLLATELAFKNEMFTGQYATPNCHGKEKVKRIKQSYNIDAYDKIYAYGDTRADQFMLDLAHEPHFRAFS